VSLRFSRAPRAAVNDSPEQLGDPRRLLGIGEVFKLALPTSLSMLNVVFMQFVDGLMVARIRPGGAEALGAQFVGGMFSFVPATLAMGALTVVNTFVAQNLGAGRLKRCGQYAWSGLYMAWVYAAALLPAVWLARPLFGLLGHAPAVQALEVMYFRYMVAALGVMLSCRVLERFFYGIHRPAVVYVVSLIANGVNILGDYVLIFGKWGFPRLGLQGAAIATVVGMTTNLAVVAAVFFGRSIARKYGTRAGRRWHAEQVRQMLRIGWPAGMQFFLDIFGWGVCISVLVGSLQTIEGVADPEASTIHLAATSVVMRFLRVSFMPAIGIGIASTALVGRYVGARQLHLVDRRVRAALILAVGYMGVCGLMFWVFRYPLLRVFLSVTPPKDPAAARQLAQIVAVGSKVMICAAVFQVADAFGIVYIGALRGAGDTLWPMVISGLLVAVIMLGGGVFIVTYWPQLESVGVWIAGSAFVAGLGASMCARFQSGQWRKIDLLGRTG